MSVATVEATSAGTLRSGQAAASEFAKIVGRQYTIDSLSGLRSYECDGLTGTRVAPALVVLPATTEEVAGCVRLAAKLGMPIVARGAGTGFRAGRCRAKGRW